MLVFLSFSEIALDNGDETDKKKRRKRRKKRKDSVSSDSDSETVNYSDMTNENISSDIISQSDFKTGGQSGGSEMNSHSESKNDLNVNSPYIKEYKNIFTEKPEVHKSEFECLCGANDLHERRRGRKKKHPIQCVKCCLWQHAECVNYDLKDPYRGEFKCPHCHVASVSIVCIIVDDKLSRL